MKAKLALIAITTFALLITQVPAASAWNQATVLAMDDYFSPQNLTVSVGTTVVWRNQGARPHTVTADNGSFDSGTLNTGEVYMLTFNTPGIYRYHCRFHGAPGGVGMAGTIVVTDSYGGSISSPPVINVPPATNYYPGICEPTYRYSNIKISRSPTVCYDSPGPTSYGWYLIYP